MTDDHDFNDDLTVIDARENLWRAVLLNTIEEAVHGGVAGISDAKERLQLIVKAREYLTKSSRDFGIVCTLAGLDPEAVRDRAIRLIAEAPSPEELATTSRRITKPSATKPGPKPRVEVRHEHNAFDKADGRDTRTRVTGKRSATGWRGRGVDFKFGRSKGTGGGSTAQDETNIDFSGKTNASSNA